MADYDGASEKTIRKHSNEYTGVYPVYHAAVVGSCHSSIFIFG